MISINNNSHWISQQAEKFPENIFLLGDDFHFSFLQAEKISDCIACAIQNQISDSRNICIIAENSPLYSLVILVLWKLNKTPVLMDPRLSESEKSHMIQSTDSRHTIAINNNNIIVDEIKIFNITELSETFLSPKTHFEFKNSDPAAIIFTSGSDDEPKAVLHSFDSLFQSALLSDTFINHQPCDKWLASLPLFHIGGFSIFLRSLICASTIIFPTSLAVDQVQMSINKFEPNFISLVSTTLRRLIEVRTSVPENLKFLFVGGGPADNAFLIRLVKSGWPIVKVYGSSETAAMISALPPDKLINQPESSGIIFPGVTVQIYKQNKDKPEGNILVKSPSLFSGYYAGESINNPTDDYGFFETGDLGYIDDDNYLFITGRDKNIIISGGEKISVTEIENTLRLFHGIREVAVFGITDNEWGESLCAVIELARGSSLTENDIEQQLKKKLSYYKIPKNIIIVSELPVTATGKPDRRKIINQFS